MRILALLLLATFARAEENCTAMLRTMVRFDGTVTSVSKSPRGTFDSVDLDPRFVIVLDAGDRTYNVGVHSLARTFGSSKITGRTFDLDAERMECDGTFRHLLTLQRHHEPVAEEFEGELEVGHRYRAKVGQDSALQKPLSLPMHHEGGVSFLNADDFKPAGRTIVFDVVARHITHVAEWEWLSMFDAKIIAVE